MFVIFSYRENFDKKEADLIKLRDRYNNISDEKISVIEKFYQKDFSDNILSEYFMACYNLSGREELDEEMRQEKKERENRQNETLSYLGEAVVFLFCLGILFLIISVFNTKINWILIAFVILLIFSISFQDMFVKKVIMSISKVMNFLNKDIKKQ